MSELTYGESPISRAYRSFIDAKDMLKTVRSTADDVAAFERQMATIRELTGAKPNMPISTQIMPPSQRDDVGDLLRINKCSILIVCQTNKGRTVIYELPEARIRDMLVRENDSFSATSLGAEIGLRFNIVSEGGNPLMVVTERMVDRKDLAQMVIDRAKTQDDAVPVVDDLFSYDWLRGERPAFYGAQENNNGGPESISGPNKEST